MWTIVSIVTNSVIVVKQSDIFYGIDLEAPCRTIFNLVDGIGGRSIRMYILTEGAEASRLEGSGGVLIDFLSWTSRSLST